MPTSRTYTFEYFMPEIHLRTVLLTCMAALMGFLTLIPKGGTGTHLILFIIFAASAFFAFLGVHQIAFWTRKTIIIVGPQGLTDQRFGPVIIPWAAIERMDTTPAIDVHTAQAENGRFVFRGLLRLLIASGIYGKASIPGNPSLTEHRDRRSIKFWLRPEAAHIEQMTPAARLRIRDNADGTQLVYLATADLSVTRKELLDLITAFHRQYGSTAEGASATA